jgi:uncharacterized protein involved in exopolysaccharide biosynthesis
MEIHRAPILGFTLLMAALTLCGVGLWLLLSPAQYRATAKIDLEPEPGDINLKGQDVSYDPYFIQTSFEVIQSEAVLGKVVEALNLNVEWGKKYAGGGTWTTHESITILRKQLRFTTVRNTKLVGISFISEDSNEAAKIANAIVEAYRDYRMEMRNKLMQKGIQVLTEEYDKEEQNIKGKQMELEQMRKQLNVPDPEPVDELLKTNYPSYFQATQELQNMIEFHKAVAAKIAAEKLGLETPHAATVQIVDAAQPPESPASPNRSLGAVLLAIGFITSLGGWLFLKPSRRSSV